MKIAYLFNKGRISKAPHVADGKVPCEFFYGGIELRKSGHEIGFFEIDINHPTGVLGGLVNIMANKGMCPEKLTGGALLQTRDIVAALDDYDVVVGTTSGIGYALSIWKCLFMLKPPIVTVHCGLFNNPYSFFRKKISSFLLSHMRTVLFGEAEMHPMIELFKGVRGKIEVNQFGVDHRFWVPAKKNCGDYILSVGNDGRRDFETLIDAAPKISSEIKILTSRKLPNELPKNITLVKSLWHNPIVSDEDLRTLYQNAKCVVVTLQDSFQPSGQSVALQAMACGCPVILTKTKGLWARELLIDGSNILLTEPGASGELAEKIRLILRDDYLRLKLIANGRLLIEQNANSDKFAANMERICTAAVHNR